MSLYLEAFSISGAWTGNARIKALSLTGWSNSDSNNDAGKVYWKVTTGNELELYLDQEMTTLLASGAIASGAVEDIADANDYGLTGSAKVEHTSGEESTGVVILTYAKESDLSAWERDVTEFLDANGQYNGEERFEEVLKRAKIKVDKLLSAKLAPLFRRKASLETDLTAIAKPEQLAEVHARYALYLLLTAVNNGDDAITSLAKDHRREAEKELDILHIELDYQSNDKIDAKRAPFGSKLTR